MPVAADYPFLEIVGTIVVLFAWVVWFWTAIMVLSDVFRRHDISGWAKAAWTILIIVFPFVGVLIYLGVHGKGMGERRFRDIDAALDRSNERYARENGGAASELAEGKRLLDSGVITESEFDQLKSRVLH